MTKAKITVPMWEHQTRIKDFAERQFALHGFAHIVAGCAVGKTLTALSVAAKENRVLVLTVKSAIYNAWVNDIKTKTEGFVIIAPTKGTVAQKLAEINELLALPTPNSTKIVIINYEAAMRMGAKALQAMDFDLVIADEIHKLKSHDSKQSKELALACQYVKKKMGLTGTSWNDKPTDVYGQFRFYDPKPTWSGKQRQIWSGTLGSWYGFFERYVTYYLMEKIKIPTGYKNLDQLGKLIDPHTFYLKTEDAIDLPPVMHINKYVLMTTEMKRAYAEMQDDMVAEFGEQLMVADCALACATRLHQLTSGVWTDTEAKQSYELEGGSPKTEALLDILEEIGNEPVVVFTRFQIDVKNIQSALDKQGISHLKLVGGCYEHDEWGKGAAQVLICNMSAGSTGVNLQRARFGIYYSTGHSATDYEQSLWRIRRPSSNLELPVVYYHLLVERSIDEEILDAITAKGDTASKLLKELKNRL